MTLGDLEPGAVFCWANDPEKWPHMLIIEWFKFDGKSGWVELSNGHAVVFDADSPMWRQEVTILREISIRKRDIG